MFAALIGFMAAAVVGATDVPPPSSAPAAANPAASDNSMDKVECRRLEETGTRLGAKRVCMTRQEWLDAAREARTMTEDVQTRGSSAKTPGS